MTAYSQTVTNRLEFYGLAAPSRWGSYNWNAFKWGEGTEVIPKNVVHLVENTLTPTEAFAGAQVVHLLTETLTPSGTYTGAAAVKLLTETLTVTEDMESETLIDGAGYRHVYPDRTTEAEDRDFATWTSGTTATGSWTSQAVASTTWSET